MYRSYGWHRQDGCVVYDFSLFLVRCCIIPIITSMRVVAAVIPSAYLKADKSLGMPWQYNMVANPNWNDSLHLWITSMRVVAAVIPSAYLKADKSLGMPWQYNMVANPNWNDSLHLWIEASMKYCRLIVFSGKMKWEMTASCMLFIKFPPVHCILYSHKLHKPFSHSASNQGLNLYIERVCK